MINPEDVAVEDIRKLLHELQIHQVELEMQNEELRETRAQLEESRGKYVDLYDFAPVGYVTLSGDGLILEANLSAARQFGVERSRLINGLFRMYVASEDRNTFDLHLKESLKTAQRQTCEIRLIPPGSPESFVRLDSLAIRDSNDTTSYNVSLIDISERRNAEEELHRYQDRLEMLVEERTGELTRANELLQLEIVERKRAEEAIFAYEEELRSMASRLALLEERERRRIATDLHDHIGQSLALAQIKLGALSSFATSTDLAKPVEEVIELIEEAIDYTRSLTFELSTPVLYELGLEAAVEWLAEQIQEKHGIEVVFKNERQLAAIGDEMRLTLFQAIRELLINTVKHAKAHTVKVCIRKESNAVRITVEDDGAGFAASKENVPSVKTNTFGLFNIRERLKYLGGYFKIESRSGHGSRITLVVPLEPGAKSRKGAVG